MENECPDCHAERFVATCYECHCVRWFPDSLTEFGPYPIQNQQTAPLPRWRWDAWDPQTGLSLAGSWFSPEAYALTVDLSAVLSPNLSVLIVSAI